MKSEKLITMRILFIPVSSKKGIGEYMRSSILADAFLQEWPDADIRFILSKEAPYHQNCIYTTLITERSPTHHVKEVNDYISSFKPDVVIFDASGRASQIRHAKKCGATTVFIAQHNKKIKKGMRLSRLRHTDLFWIAQPDFTVQPLRWIDKLKLTILKKPLPVYLGCIYTPPGAQEELDVLSKYKLESGNYIFISAGSGGHFMADHTLAADGFHQAMKLLASDMPSIQVWGANYPGEFIPDSDSKFININQAPNSEFVCLLKNAKIALINGGGTLLQAFSLQIPALAVPVSADQPARIEAALRKTTCCLYAPADVSRIVEGLISLSTPETQVQLRSNMAELDVLNGYSKSVEALKVISNT